MIFIGTLAFKGMIEHDIARYGANEQTIVEHYVRQQEAMIRYIEQSLLSWLVLDTTGQEWDRLAEQMLECWFQ